MSHRPNTPTSGGSTKPVAHHQNSHSSTSTVVSAPPGFETLYTQEHSKVSTLFQAFVLPLHWSLIRGGLRLRKNDNTNAIAATTIPLNEITEFLHSDWTGRITSKVEDGSDQLVHNLVLRYWDPLDSKVHYEAKVVEVVKNNVLVVILFRGINSYGADGTFQAANQRDMNTHSSERNSAAGNFTLTEYFTRFSINILSRQGGGLGNKEWFEVYKNLETLEKVIWEQLMEPAGFPSGKSREPGPYENSSAGQQSQQTQQQPQQQQQQQQEPLYYPQQPLPPYPAGGIGGPLHVPPVGGGGLGRSDLDPVGGFGNGMVADPRGFRQPAVIPFGGGGVPGGPGAIIQPPPGARFDPFGPPAPNPRPLPGTGGGGGAGNNFGNPNPDAEQPPPGFEDIYM